VALRASIPPPCIFQEALARIDAPIIFIGSFPCRDGADNDSQQVENLPQRDIWPIGGNTFDK